VPVDLQFLFVVKIAIHDQQSRRALLLVVNRRHIQIVDVAESRNGQASALNRPPERSHFVARPLRRKAQRATVRVLQRPGIRVEDRLTQNAILVRRNRRNHIDQLRQARHLYPVRVPDQRVREASHQHSILQVVGFFQQMLSRLPMPICKVAIAGAIPHIPLVERQEQLLARALVCAHGIANRHDLLDLPVHAHVHRQVLRAVVVVLLCISKVTVQRDAIYHVVALFQHRLVPFDIGWLERPARPACNQLDGWIERPHLPGGIRGLEPVVARFHEPNLPLFSIVPRSGEPTIERTAQTGIAFRDETRPVYVLVSEHTWSAGEGVPFLLQERHRAKVIGQNTAGAANPAAPWDINQALTVTIPFGRIESSMAGKNWEGTGVVPDLIVSPDKAFQAAYVQALESLLAQTPDAPKRQVLTNALTNATK